MRLFTVEPKEPAPKADVRIPKAWPVMPLTELSGLILL